MKDDDDMGGGDERHSQQWFESLLVAIPVGVFEADAAGGLTYVNERWCEMAGISHEQALGDGWLTSLTPASREAGAAARQSAVSSRSPSRVELQFLNGTWVLVYSVPLHGPSRAVVGHLGTITDISATKRAEETARLALARANEAQRLAKIGSWELDLRTNTLVWSDEAFRVFELDPATFRASYEQFLDAVHPDDREAVNAAYRESLTTKQPYEIIHRLRLRDGRIKWVQERGTTFYAADGTALRSVGTVQDISERRHAEEQREQAERERAALEAQLRHVQKLEALGTLAGGIAHDFNNLLTAIGANIGLAQRALAPDHRVRHALDDVASAASRAGDLVRQILAFGRRQPLNRVVTSLEPVVREVARLLRATLPAGIELTVKVAPDVPAVLADPSQIHQVLMNLGTNAWHALDGRNGHIAIELDRGPDEQVCLRVRDDGAGMDAATIERIFEPFFTTKETGRGSGLGLSVVHGIVRDHDGRIEVDSATGRGSTFTIYLHAAEPSVATSEVAPDQVTTPAARGRVLLLDDEELVRAAAMRMLQYLGYEVTAFASAVDALAAVRANPAAFDVVITDNNMPGISGVEVMRELAGVRADLPVVLASGLSESSVEVRHRLAKPFTLDDLALALQRALART